MFKSLGKRLFQILGIPSVIYFLAVLLVYSCLGVLLKKFNADEIFYLHSGWFHKVSQNPYLFPKGMFDALLEAIWSFLRGDLSRSWELRLILLIFVFLQGAMFFQITRYVVSKDSPGSFALRLLFAVCFISVIAAFRGYEIRPEVFANTGLILGVLAMFKLAKQDSPKTSNWLLTVVAICGLILSSAISMRHFLLSGLLILSLFYFLYLLNLRRSTLIFSVIFALSVGISTHLLEFNIFDRVAYAENFQSVRTPAGLVRKFTVGAGYFYLILFIPILFSFLMISLKLRIRELSERVIFLFLVMCFLVLLHIFFTIKFDVQPFEYVRSIEWILIVSAFSGLIFAFQENPSVQQRAGRYFSVLLIAFLGIVLRAGKLNFFGEPTHLAIAGLLNSQSDSRIKSLSDGDLVRLFIQSPSIFDQVRARSEYCSRYSASFVAVTFFDDHPVCLSDGGKYPQMVRRIWEAPGFDPSNFVYFAFSKNEKFDFERRNLKSIPDISNRTVWIREPNLR